MGGIAVIHNPFARGNLRRPAIVEKLREIVNDFGEVIVTRNIEQLPEVAREFLKKEIEILGINGGDGSLHLTLSVLVNVFKDKSLPKIIALRGGTMNTMPNSVGLKGKTLEILKKVIEKYQKGEPLETIKQHLVRLNDQYGFMSGAGLPPNFLSAYYGGTSTGPWQAVKVIARAIGSAMVNGPYIKFLFEPARCQIEIEGEEIPSREFTAILACSIKEIGLGFTPTPRAYEKPGHFHFVATTLAPLKVIPRIPTIWLGRELKHPEVFSRVASRVLLKPLANLRYMIDGEIYETETPIEMTCGPTIELIKV